jgi:hypothetical protein
MGSAKVAGLDVACGWDMTSRRKALTVQGRTSKGKAGWQAVSCGVHAGKAGRRAATAMQSSSFSNIGNKCLCTTPAELLYCNLPVAELQPQLAFQQLASMSVSHAYLPSGFCLWRS